MKRRQFIGTVTALPLIPNLLHAQAGPPPLGERVEKMTAPNWPTINCNHLGFRPRVGSKSLVVRAPASPAPTEYQLRDVSESDFGFTSPLKKESGSDFGPCLTADFTDLERPGLYQIVVGNERSVQFAIRDDVWRRTLPKAVGYYRYQRCGVEVPGVHPACHLDDARRRDTGEHVDTVGGWHDAGDLRKWMDVTMLNAVALLNLYKNNPLPRPGDPTPDQILEEVRFGNRYFLKMQDTDGKLWADVAGGVNGDNSDNHWTDNIIGTPDDRYLNPEKRSGTAAVFATLEALAAQCYAASDPAYAHQCLDAATRAWQAFGAPALTEDLGWWALATAELFLATGAAMYKSHAQLLGRDLLKRQNTEHLAGQKEVRGFWMQGSEPYVDVVNSAVPPLALLKLYDTFPDAPDRSKWLDAVRLHADEYLLPMSNRNAYRIIPLGVYLGSPTPEKYRPLAGDLTYRNFQQTRKGFWWLGANCHYASNALALGWLARLRGDAGKPYVSLAYRQLEWIVGANPFASSMMTGEGMRNPFPHSRFVGLIPGGIMNGIAGNVNDEPILDLENTLDWRTCEYWSPHVAFYIWANSVLEGLG